MCPRGSVRRGPPVEPDSASRAVQLDQWSLVRRPTAEAVLRRRNPRQRRRHIFVRGAEGGDQVTLPRMRSSRRRTAHSGEAAEAIRRWRRALRSREPLETPVGSRRSRAGPRLSRISDAAVGQKCERVTKVPRLIDQCATREVMARVREASTSPWSRWTRQRPDGSIELRTRAIRARYQPGGAEQPARVRGSTGMLQPALQQAPECRQA